MFYCVMFYSVMFYSVMFHSVMFYSVTFYYVMFYSVTFFSAMVYSVMFYSVMFYSVMFYSVMFYSVMFHSDLECYVLSHPVLPCRLRLYSILHYPFLLRAIQPIIMNVYTLARATDGAINGTHSGSNELHYRTHLTRVVSLMQLLRSVFSCRPAASAPYHPSIALARPMISLLGLASKKQTVLDLILPMQVVLAAAKEYCVRP